ncbi:rho guanine nucleotide exchange factor 19 [Eucyclogobius newberryi]|uniref:rho guanine nucleotide exchange factor 19 n=1 Tax=Eucyclogobius newberryi TaxID=166745 RepID=UPI003B5A0F11
MCSRLQDNLSGNGFMPLFSAVKPEQLSTFQRASTEAEPDSSKPDHSPSTDSVISMASKRTLDFDKIFFAARKLLFDPLDSEEIHEEDEAGSQSHEGQVQSGRVHSMFLHNLPLYQVYYLQNVRDDIQRLKKSSLSELVLPQCVQGLQTALGQIYHSQSPPVCSTPPTPIRVTPSTLWQDLEEVKASGVLRNMSGREIRLHETSFELICSEASYMRSLEIAVNHFYASKTLNLTLAKMQHHILFSNIQRVMVASEKFLTDLELRLGECILIGSQIGDVVLRHCPAFHCLYVPYVTNMMYQEALIRQLLQQNKDFQNALSKLEKNPVCQRQSLKSFLVLPFQRITRIKLILETILKLTKLGSDSFTNLEKAIRAIHELLQECDCRVQKMKQIEELVCLEMQLVFGKVKSIPLVVSGRFLVHEGPVKQLSLASSGHPRMPFTNNYLHLLSDMLIISTKRDEYFKVLDHAEFPACLRCEPLKAEVLGLPPNSFLLHLSKRQTGDATVLILVTDTRSAKETWMKALSSKK